jgi:hypothetical protein
MYTKLKIKRKLIMENRSRRLARDRKKDEKSERKNKRERACRNTGQKIDKRTERKREQEYTTQNIRNSGLSQPH